MNRIVLGLCLGWGMGLPGAGRCAETPAATALPCDPAAVVLPADPAGRQQVLGSVEDSPGAAWRVLVPTAAGADTWMTGPQFATWRRKLNRNRSARAFHLQGRLRICNPTGTWQYWSLAGAFVYGTVRVRWPYPVGDTATHWTVHPTKAGYASLLANRARNRTYGALAVPPHSTHELVLELVQDEATLEATLPEFHLDLAPLHPAYLVDREHELVRGGIFVGGILLMVLINGMWFFVACDRLYLDYLLVLVCALGINLFNTSQVWNSIVSHWENTRVLLGDVSFLLLPVAYLVFSRHYLPLQRYGLRRLDRWLRWLVVVTAVLPVLVVLVNYPALNVLDVPFQVGVALTLGLVVVGMIVGFTSVTLAAVQVVRRGHHTSRTFLLANLVLPITWGILVGIRLADGRVTVAQQQLTMGIGGLLEMVLFSLAMMQRYREQRAALQAAEEHAARLLADRNRDLEEQVALRTEEIRVQNEQLEAAFADLQAADREKDEIMGIAAHDLKNPIAAIQMFSNTLAAGAASGSPELDYARNISSAAGHMMDIVGKLLDVSKLESGHHEVQLVAVDVREVVRQLAEQYRQRAAAKRIALHTDVAAAPEPVAAADHLSLLQVLDNLLSNALKFSPPGTSVTLAVMVQDDEVLIRVQDQGPGLTAADQQGLFQKFSRLSARPTAGESSTGLGLSIVHKLVELMDGRIEVASTPGAGAAFTVRLNLAASYFVQLPTGQAEPAS